ncbi:hypothetical protein ANO11243_021020 [Dothideomycetidae sp. 11243]|nr:hypothetical protein ANO11243_021020 [fungal sp. No.11243]
MSESGAYGGSAAAEPVPTNTDNESEEESGDSNASSSDSDEAEVSDYAPSDGEAASDDSHEDDAADQAAGSDVDHIEEHHNDDNHETPSVSTKQTDATMPTDPLVGDARIEASTGGAHSELVEDAKHREDQPASSTPPDTHRPRTAMFDEEISDFDDGEVEHLSNPLHAHED